MKEFLSSLDSGWIEVLLTILGMRVPSWLGSSLFSRRIQEVQLIRNKRALIGASVRGPRFSGKTDLHGIIKIPRDFCGRKFVVMSAHPSDEILGSFVLLDMDGDIQREEVTAA